MATAVMIAVMAVSSDCATADPIVIHPVSAPVSQLYRQLIPGTAGSMWFVQGTDVERMDQTGAVVADSGPITGGVGELAPASDGGAWVFTFGSPTLTHVAVDGSQQAVTLPAHIFVWGDIIQGKDGRVWMLGCADTPASAGASSETCDVFAVAVGGALSTYPLPTFSQTFPAGTHGQDFQGRTIVATSNGVWVNRLVLTPQQGGRVDAGPPEVAFVSYSGSVTAATLPAGAELLAPATGDDAWWLSPWDASPMDGSSLTLGKIAPGGSATAVGPLSYLADPSDYQATLKIQAGRDGQLLWAEQTPLSTAQTGLLGRFTDQGETQQVIPSYAAAVPPPTPFGSATWSGNCNFGNDLFEAANGNIWVLSSGHPARLSVMTPAGAFSTFLPVPSTTQDFGISDMAESSTGQLWFAVASSADGVTPNLPPLYALAVANPLSPPPGLPRFPTAGTPAGSSNTQPTAPSMSSLTVKASRGKHRHGLALALTLSAPAQIHVRFDRWVTRAHHRKTLLYVGSISSAGVAGPNHLTITKVAGRSLASGRYVLRVWLGGDSRSGRTASINIV